MTERDDKNQGPACRNRTDEMVAKPSSRASFKVARFISFFVLLGVIVVIGVLSFKVMQSFVLPLFLAALLVVIFEPVHEWVVDRCRGNKRIAAGLTTAAILLIVLAPVVWVVTVGVMEAIELLDPAKHLVASVSAENVEQGDTQPSDPLDPVRDFLGLQMPYKEDLGRLELELDALHLDDDKTIALTAIRNTGPVIEEFRESVAKFQARMESDEQALSNGIHTGEDDSPLKAASDVQRLANSRRRLEQMTDPIALLVENVRNLPESGATSADLHTYDELVKGLGDSYRAMRVELLGGSVWTPVVSFANPSEERLRRWKSSITDTLRVWMLQLSGRTPSLMGSFFIQFFVLTIATYYFLLDGPQMVQSAIELSPMEDHYERELIAEFGKLSRAVVLATLLSAIAQGLLAGMGYFAVFGFNSLFLLVILTTVMALVPFVGAAAVWVPVCLYVAFYQQNYWGAGGLALWGFLVVSMADNIIKPLVLKGQSNLHPLFALLSVLGGLQALGPIGVLVGPMVVAFLQSLLNILHRDLKRLDGQDGMDSARVDVAERVGDDAGKDATVNDETEEAPKTE